MSKQSTSKKVKEEKPNKTVKDELLYIKKKNHGLLVPEKVLDFARNPNTALHSRFEWDDAKASHEYRLWQARKVIRLEIVVLTPSEGVIQQVDFTVRPTRAYVSLRQDRVNGGYRGIEDVMKNETLRKQCLKDALKELKHFKEKYSFLKELAKVFEIIDELDEEE
jgi:hypothetical protein